MKKLKYKYLRIHIHFMYEQKDYFYEFTHILRVFCVCIYVVHWCPQVLLKLFVLSFTLFHILPNPNAPLFFALYNKFFVQKASSHRLCY